MATIDVTDNPDQQRYEAHLDGELAGFAEYRDVPGRRIFTHTQDDPAFEGHGVGGTLASGALDDVRRLGLAVVPRCPFIAAYIERHPDYADLVYDQT
jgi:predicted GNAT family acetyltransferase